MGSTRKTLVGCQWNRASHGRIENEKAEFYFDTRSRFFALNRDDTMESDNKHMYKTPNFRGKSKARSPLIEELSHKTNSVTVAQNFISLKIDRPRHRAELWELPPTFMKCRQRKRIWRPKTRYNMVRWTHRRIGTKNQMRLIRQLSNRVTRRVHFVLRPGTFREV